MGKKRRKRAERAMEEVGRRVRHEPRYRDFPWLGWTVFLVPMDLVTPAVTYVPEIAGGFTRNVARMMVGTVWGFKPDELINLRARRLQLEDEPERMWWVMATPKAVFDSKRRPAKA